MATQQALRAIVVGTGFAGEGHTLALRRAGVEVLALCGRELSVVQARAAALGVPLASTDWRATLEALRPELVALATPAALRRDVIEAAVALGCHIYCDKPLATTASEAQALWELVAAAGVKHAYGATRRYEPSVVRLAERVQAGELGPVREVLYQIRAQLAPPLPWSWALSLEQGGGLLNGHFPHVLSILERVLGGTLTQARGQARFAIDRAPVIAGIHDFRDWGTRADTLTPDELAAAEWRHCDVDTSYAALLRFATPTGDVPVTLVSGPLVERAELRLIGEHGVLVAHGESTFEINGEPLAPTNTCEDRWAALAQDFVADIRGEPHAPYLTFQDGVRYQEAIAAIRNG